MSFITSGAWARPVQDASKAWVWPNCDEGGCQSFENDVAKDIYDITQNRAAAYGGFFAKATSAGQARSNINGAFEAAGKLYASGFQISEVEATIALSALNLASNGEYGISAEEADYAWNAISGLGTLIERNCKWNQTDAYCTERGTPTQWGRLFERARDLLYSPSQRCEPKEVMGLGLLFALYDTIKLLDPVKFAPTNDLFCQTTEEYFGKHLEEANEYLTTVITGLTKFYPQYWR